jgi:hypothetical protein
MLGMFVIKSKVPITLFSILLAQVCILQGIFKTDIFYDKFEIQAKQNLQKELELLR